MGSCVLARSSRSAFATASTSRLGFLEILGVEGCWTPCSLPLDWRVAQRRDCSPLVRARQNRNVDDMESTLTSLQSCSRFPKNWLGQHYMVNETVNTRIVYSAQSQPDDFSGPLASSDAAAEAQDHIEGFSRDGPVQTDLLFRKERIQVDKPELSQGHQAWTPKLDAKGPATSALPKGATAEDAGYMRMAVRLARKAIGKTSPNPMVGCVIVKDGQIVGRGFHPKAGEPHAEVFALREAGKNAEGATVYVSLEPCNHTGRTPPCSQALVQARVKRVVIGTVDTNPLVGGKGVQTLEQAGIDVVVGVEEPLCRGIVEAFFHHIVTKKPFVTLRYRMSLDGEMLGSCEYRSQQGCYDSLLLQEHDAVVITNACVHDNPRLLSCEPDAKQPLRVVLTKSLDLPLESQVFDTTLAPTLVLTDLSVALEDMDLNSRRNGMLIESNLKSKGVDLVAVNGLNLDSILEVLHQRGFNSVLLDSRGPDNSGLENYFAQMAITEQAAQKLVVIISPVLAGGRRGGLGFSVQNELLKLQRVSTRMEGEDIIVDGYFPKSDLK